MVAERGPVVLGAEAAPLLEEGHHLVGELVEATRRDVGDEDESVGGVLLHERVDLVGHLRRRCR